MKEIKEFYSQNFDSIKRKKGKIKFLVFHYTGMKNQISAIKRLQSRVAKVSCHYLISKKGKIYNETLDNWKYLVGKDLFKVSFPKSYKSSNKLSGSRLNILVKRGNEVDVEYSKKEIIKKINVF